MGGKYSVGHLIARSITTNWRLLLATAGLTFSLMVLAYEPTGGSQFRHFGLGNSLLAATERNPTAIQSAYASAAAERRAHQARAGGLAAPDGADWINIPVRSGDTLSSLFERYAIPSQDWRDALALGGRARELRNLRVGTKLHIRHHSGRMVELRYDLSNDETLRITRDGSDELVASMSKAPTVVKHAYSVGTIEISLADSAKLAKLPANLVMDLATIFGWDIDFAQDIRSGDRFAVIYEETYRFGKRVGTGDIVAAEFVNQGSIHRAYRYAGKGGSRYFDEDGHPMRKAFLRSPVDFTRITSGFGWRKHPIAGVWRKHQGIDYAAASGTPVKASGEGKVKFRGWRNGYGNTVIIQHGGGVETVYAHLSRFASNTRQGRSVDQGETIGFVGQTGWATGPHLHYEFRLNGKVQNPLALKVPMAEPLPKKLRSDFSYRIQPYVAQLDALSSIKLAKNDH